MPFTATGYVPQYGDRIAELMMRQGEIAARGAERSGLIWGRAIENLGQIAGSAVESYQKQKQEKTRGAAFQSLLADGRWQTDPSILLSGATKIYGPEHGPVIAKAAWEWSKITGKGDAEDEKRIGHTLVGLGRMTDAEAAPLWPGVLQKAVPWMKNRGISPDQVPQEWTPGMGPKVANFGLMLTGEAPAAPVRPAGEVVDTFDAQGRHIKRRATEAELGTGVPVYDKPATPENLSAEEAFIKARFGANPTPEQMLQGRAEFAAAGRGPQEPDEAITLTPQALDLTAELYAKTGQLPAMGMGKKGASVRQQIINRAAELHPGADIAGSKAGYEADKGSMTVMQKQVDAVTAFENTASKNAEILKGLLDKIPNYKNKWANKAARDLSAALGSEEMARFNTIRQSVANEYSRIISNPTLAGVMSDSARAEGSALLDPDATAGQIRAAIETLAAEAKNRHTEYQGQLDVIKKRMKGAGGAPTGEVVEWEIGPDGKPRPKGR